MTAKEFWETKASRLLMEDGRTPTLQEYVEDAFYFGYGLGLAATVPLRRKVTPDTDYPRQAFKRVI